MNTNTQEPKEEFYFFWKHQFGQWTKRDITVAGIKYFCNEQHMMAEKARLFNDPISLDRIMRSRDPKEIKAFGRKVSFFNKNQWNTVCKNIVFIGNLAKFTQLLDLQELLLSTGTKTLVEASPYDLIWGCGLSASDPRILDRKQWLGTNWLGEVLMDVREGIRRNKPKV